MQFSKEDTVVSLRTLNCWLSKDKRYEVMVHPRSKINTHFPIRTKLRAIKMVYNDNINVKVVAKAVGATFAMVYRWLKAYEVKGEYGLMGKKEIKHTTKWIEKKRAESAQYIKELEAKILQLQMENDVLEEVNKIAKKCPGLRPQELMIPLKVKVVNSLRPKHNLAPLLKIIELTKSTYDNYGFDFVEFDRYEEQRKLVHEVFYNSDQTYGSYRIWWSLRKSGITIAEKIIRIIMKEDGLVVYRKNMKRLNTYDASKDTSYAPNLLNREFDSEKPFVKLVTDITQFDPPFGKIYLSAVLDLHDGKILSWKIDDNYREPIVLDMLDDLIPQLPFYEYIILHSDRGVHYHAKEYIKKLESRGIVQSMSKKGCSPDNSVMEGFFGHLKNEFWHKRDYTNHTKEEFTKALNNWIIWYNDVRIKMVLGGMSPNEYRKNLGIVI
jgi:transposase InsO family protein/transposase-like protein